MKTHPESITKEDKNMVDDRDYGEIKFSVSKKDYSRIERENNFYFHCYY